MCPTGLRFFYSPLLVRLNMKSVTLFTRLQNKFKEHILILENTPYCYLIIIIIKDMILACLIEKNKIKNLLSGRRKHNADKVQLNPCGWKRAKATEKTIMYSNTRDGDQRGLLCIISSFTTPFFVSLWPRVWLNFDDFSISTPFFVMMKQKFNAHKATYIYIHTYTYTLYRYSKQLEVKQWM